MKYLKARFVNNGSEQTVSLINLSDDDRLKYKDKLFCPEPGCPAKLYEFRRNESIFYKATPLSHNEECMFKDEVNGIREAINSGEIEVEISEEHMRDSIRRSYLNSTKPKIKKGVEETGPVKRKAVKSGSGEDKKLVIRGVINKGGNQSEGKEPPILNKEMIQDTDVGYPRKLVNIEISSVKYEEDFLKIGFTDNRYSNIDAIAGEAYINEKRLENISLSKIGKFIENNLNNNTKVSFWGGGIINKRNDRFILELFYKDSFIINGLTPLKMSILADEIV